MSSKRHEAIIHAFVTINGGHGPRRRFSVRGDTDVSSHADIRAMSTDSTAEEAMHNNHPIFGNIVTSHRLVRGGRWVFRGTIIHLDDVFDDFASGLNLNDVWEKHGALDRRDLEAVAAHAFGEHALALGVLPRTTNGRAEEQDQRHFSTELVAA